MSADAPPPLDPHLDRFCELANVGAGHAADALAEIVGMPIRMTVPRPGFGPAACGAGDLAVLFDVDGGPGGVLALLFPSSARQPLVEALLGADRSDPGLRDSALRELGNILASRALSAVADLIGASIRPSLPVLAPGGDAPGFPRPDGPSADAEVVRVETDLVDRAGVVRGRLVWLPAIP